MTQHRTNGEDRDKTPTARLASPPPAAESNAMQSTISRLENKYADILNKIARRKRLEGDDEDAAEDALPTTIPKSVRSRNDDRERTLEADNSALLKNVIDSTKSTSRRDDGGVRSSFGGLAKSSTVIHIPPGANKSTTKPETRYGLDKEDKVGSGGKYADTRTEHLNGNGSGGDSDVGSYLARYKNRNDRDTSNRYKDTSDLIESLKAPAKSNYNHYGHYEKPEVDSVSAYYKSRYEPDAEKLSASSASSSAASRRTKSYRTRKEASKERKHLTLKLSAVNMDIDSPPPPPATTSKPAGTSASGRSYKQYGAARKSLGTGLSSGGGYQRSQTQKLLYDFDDNDIYHPPTARDNKRKEIQNVIRKYAQYDDEDLRRTTANPYSTNPMKSATSANLAYKSGGGSSGLYSSDSGRRDPIADHYGLGLGSSGSSYYPRSHNTGYEYPPSPYGASALAKANPYLSSRQEVNPYNPLSKTHSTAAFYNSSYLGGAGGSAAASAAAQRSRKNLMSFVRKNRFIGCCVLKTCGLAKEE